MKVQLPGIIQIILPGYTFEETERCREVIHNLFESDFFTIKNGRALIDFNHEGVIQKIGVDMIRWKRDKLLTSPQAQDRIKVQVKTPTEAIGGIL